MQPELVAFLLRRLGRNHHAGAVGELRDQRRVGRLQHQLDGQGIDHLDVIDTGEFRFAERSRHRHVPLDREFRGLRIERFAVLEFHAGPKLDRHRLAVGGGLIGQRKLRHDVELFVDVEQLVAEGGEHDAADIGARQRGIENIGVLGEADAQASSAASAAAIEATATAPPSIAAKRKIFIGTVSSIERSFACRRRCIRSIPTPERTEPSSERAEGRHQSAPASAKSRRRRARWHPPAAVPRCGDRRWHGPIHRQAMSGASTRQRSTA